jgi:hypothetical protein
MWTLGKWIKEFAMSDNTLHRGLCSTCKHAPNCSFPGDVQRPAFYCEEFEIEITPARKTSEEGTSKSSTSSIAIAEKPTGLIGLCNDCESRQGCVFPKPEGGIWHCEEYQ